MHTAALLILLSLAGTVCAEGINPKGKSVTELLQEIDKVGRTSPSGGGGAAPASQVVPFNSGLFSPNQFPSIEEQFAGCASTPIGGRGVQDFSCAMMAIQVAYRAVLRRDITDKDKMNIYNYSSRNNYFGTKNYGDFERYLVSYLSREISSMERQQQISGIITRGYQRDLGRPPANNELQLMMAWNSPPSTDEQIDNILINRLATDDAERNAMAMRAFIAKVHREPTQTELQGLEKYAKESGRTYQQLYDEIDSNQEHNDPGPGSGFETPQLTSLVLPYGMSFTSFRNKQHNKCLASSGNHGYTAGNGLVIEECTTDRTEWNERFTPRPQGDGTMMIADESGKLCIYGVSSDAMAIPIIYPRLYQCENIPAMRWQYTGNGELRNVENGLCLDIPTLGGMQVGPSVQARKCNGGDNQKWIRNVINHTEQCFGAVGPGCKGVSMFAPVTSEKTSWGTTYHAWVSVGAIMHDMCCLKNPNGQHCADASAADFALSEVTQAFGLCTAEWRQAAYDVWNRRMWKQDFGPYPDDTWSDDLTQVSGREAYMPDRNLNYIHQYEWGETAGTSALVAPEGAKLDASDEAFCRFKKFSTTDFKAKAFDGKISPYGICY